MSTIVSLNERMTFDALFRVSDPKRIFRSDTVRGPPLEIDSYQDAVYYCFNFKSNPSTTGLRHRGYIKFFKPKNNRQQPLHRVQCLVDCECPDFRYRWAWTNKQRGSSRVGPGSLNQAWNKAPRITNPQGRPGLCKHILAARQYIYGLLSSFPSNLPDTAEKLNKLTKHAQKRWTDFPGQVAAAKAQEIEIARQRALRNIGRLPPEPPAAPAAPIVPEIPPAPAAPAAAPDARTDEPDRRKKKEAPQFKGASPVPLPTKPATPEKPATPYGGYRSKAEQDFYTRQGLGDSRTRSSENILVEHVVKSNIEDMNDLKQAIALVEEMEDELIDAGATAPGAAEAPPDPSLEPSEPPISDTAIGADTEGDTALGLLQQMKDLLTRIADQVAPPETEGELPPGEEGAGDLAGDMPPLPPDEEIPDEGELPPEEGAEEEEEEKERAKKPPFESAPNRRFNKQ